jgi:hypothetical protein
VRPRVELLDDPRLEVGLDAADGDVEVPPDRTTSQ